MPIYDQIITACQPYWHVRANAVHVPESYHFAQQLLKLYPAADPLIVLPAILMHDNGYANVPQETLLQGLADAPTGYKPDITRLHELEGAKIARTILQALNYDEVKTETICQIIDGHDSRQKALSLEDALVKDADKLWRFSLNGVQIAGQGWMKMATGPFIDYCVSRIDKWMLTQEATRMARQLAKETREAL